MYVNTNVIFAPKMTLASSVFKLLALSSFYFFLYVLMLVLNLGKYIFEGTYKRVLGVRYSYVSRTAIVSEWHDILKRAINSEKLCLECNETQDCCKRLKNQRMGNLRSLLVILQLMYSNELLGLDNNAIYMEKCEPEREAILFTQVPYL